MRLWRCAVPCCLFFGLLTDTSLAQDDAKKTQLQNISSIMTREEAEAELFGVWMEGQTAQTKDHWSECIEPDGKTIYRFANKELVGKLFIQDDGKACFAYKADDYSKKSCFRISRTADGYTFWGGAEGVFTTTSVQTGVKTCPSDNTPTG